MSEVLKGAAKQDGRFVVYSADTGRKYVRDEEQASQMVQSGKFSVVDPAIPADAVDATDLSAFGEALPLPVVVESTDEQNGSVVDVKPSKRKGK